MCIMSRQGTESYRKGFGLRSSGPFAFLLSRCVGNGC